MRDEADPQRDVHADAHVHVPHEHALLCLSSLRWPFTLTGRPGLTGAWRINEEAASKRCNFLFC